MKMTRKPTNNDEETRHVAESYAALAKNKVSELDKDIIGIEAELSNERIRETAELDAKAKFIRDTSEYRAREFVVRSITIAFILGAFTLPFMALFDIWCETCVDENEIDVVFTAMKELFLPIVALVYGYYFGAMRRDSGVKRRDSDT